MPKDGGTARKWQSRIFYPRNVFLPNQGSFCDPWLLSLEFWFQESQAMGHSGKGHGILPGVWELALTSDRGFKEQGGVARKRRALEAKRSVCAKAQS